MFYHVKIACYQEGDGKFNPRGLEFPQGSGENKIAPWGSRDGGGDVRGDFRGGRTGQSARVTKG